MIKAIIFDFDGVILESTEVKTKAFGKLFASEGEKVAKTIVEYHKNHSGTSRYLKFDHIYKNILCRELSKKERSQLGDQFSKICLEEVLASPFVPGVREFLEQASQKYSLYISSGAPHDEIQDITRKLNIQHFFKAIYGFPNLKSDIAEQVKKEEGLQSSEVVFIGDSGSDLKAAEKNGTHFIGRSTPDNLELFQAAQFPVVRNLVGLEKIIESLSKN